MQSNGDHSDTTSNKSAPNPISSPRTSKNILLQPLIPPIPHPPLFDFNPSTSKNLESVTSTSISEYHRLLKPPKNSSTSVDLSVAILLDSLIPSTSLPPSPIIPPRVPSTSHLLVSTTAQTTLIPTKEGKKITTTSASTTTNKKTPIIPITTLPSSPRNTKSTSLRRSIDSNTSTSSRKTEKKLDSREVEVKGRYESDLSTRSLGMGKEVNSLLDELLDDSGFMMDDDDSY